MYEKIGFSFALIFLAGLTGNDIRKRQIPVKKLLLFGIGAVLYLLYEPDFSMRECLINLMPGMFLLLLAVISKESIGYGDGFAVMIFGLWTNILFCMTVVCLALCMAGIFAAYLLLQKRKIPIPFVPFILAAMEVILVYA